MDERFCALASDLAHRAQDSDRQHKATVAEWLNELQEVEIDDKALDDAKKKLSNHLDVPSPDSVTISLFGRTGVGKSTLKAVLSGDERVIDGISDGRSGATDLIQDEVASSGIRIIDCPGIGFLGEFGDSHQAIAIDAIRRSDMLLLVFDTQSQTMSNLQFLAERAKLENKPVLAVLNVRDRKWLRDDPGAACSAADVNTHVQHIRSELQKVLPNVPAPIPLSAKRALFARFAPRNAEWIKWRELFSVQETLSLSRVGELEQQLMTLLQKNPSLSVASRLQTVRNAHKETLESLDSLRKMLLAKRTELVQEFATALSDLFPPEMHAERFPSRVFGQHVAQLKKPSGPPKNALFTKLVSSCETIVMAKLQLHLNADLKRTQQSGERHAGPVFPLALITELQDAVTANLRTEFPDAAPVRLTIAVPRLARIDFITHKTAALVVGAVSTLAGVVVGIATAGLALPLVVGVGSLAAQAVTERVASGSTAEELQVISTEAAKYQSSVLAFIRDTVCSLIDTRFRPRCDRIVAEGRRISMQLQSLDRCSLFISQRAPVDVITTADTTAVRRSVELLSDERPEDPLSRADEPSSATESVRRRSDIGTAFQRLDDLVQVTTRLKDVLPEDTAAILTHCQAVRARWNRDQLCRVVFVGEYNAGKSSLIKRLLHDAGLRSEHVQVGAQPTTAETTEYPYEDGIVLVDTVGISGANQQETASLRQQCGEGDVLVLCTPPQLATGEEGRAVVANLTSVQEWQRHMLVAIGRADEIGTDPEFDLEGFRQGCDRKRIEAATLFKVEPQRIHVVAAKERAPAWDGIAKFCTHLHRCVVEARASRPNSLNKQVRTHANQLKLALLAKKSQVEQEITDAEIILAESDVREMLTSRLNTVLASSVNANRVRVLADQSPCFPSTEDFAAADTVVHQTLLERVRAMQERFPKETTSQLLQLAARLASRDSLAAIGKFIGYKARPWQYVKLSRVLGTALPIAGGVIETAINLVQFSRADAQTDERVSSFEQHVAQKVSQMAEEGQDVISGEFQQVREKLEKDRQILRLVEDALSFLAATFPAATAAATATAENTAAEA
eukprot:TRINITY_DN4442_c0_g1_i10.p1 TRINITY_DN4442_c0_g1~~TRINITY_DN4442_c0_g1_i10.p1  ORF type:complete len:1077 (-),score=242.51 TRINITY_DN4442_c0_g1_i10:2208-5438(-)